MWGWKKREKEPLALLASAPEDPARSTPTPDLISSQSSGTFPSLSGLVGQTGGWGVGSRGIRWRWVDRPREFSSRGHGLPIVRRIILVGSRFSGSREFRRSDRDHPPSHRWSWTTIGDISAGCQEFDTDSKNSCLHWWPWSWMSRVAPPSLASRNSITYRSIPRVSSTRRVARVPWSCSILVFDVVETSLDALETFSTAIFAAFFTESVRCWPRWFSAPVAWPFLPLLQIKERVSLSFFSSPCPFVRALGHKNYYRVYNTPCLWNIRTKASAPAERFYCWDFNARLKR